jgi:hypothetical protein
MPQPEKQSTTWPDLAIGLYDKLTGRNAEITYHFEDFSLYIPRQADAPATTQWKMDGKVTISTRNNEQ